MKPPSMKSLLEDPVYRRYVRTVPVLAPSLRHGTPWAVWARIVDGAWRGAMFATYQEAWPVVVKTMRNDQYEDVAVVSRRQLFGPPPAFVWDDIYFQWCWRCRRPTRFGIRPRHHALKRSPVMTTDNPDRCYFCGMRRCAMPYH